MFKSKNNLEIKIIDFGLSIKQKFKGINKDVKKIGTPKFMAPEVIVGQYS
jgi:serine/threonine protein kinase